MFAPTYFAPTYFAGDYFATGQSAAPPVGVALKYFPKEYFAPTFFAPSYFPGATFGVVTTTSTGIFEAVAQFIAGSTQLQAVGFAGFWADQKPRGEPNPAIVFKVPDAAKVTSDSDTIWSRLSPSLHVLAPTKDSADSLVEQVVAIFKNQTFAYGPSGSVLTGPWWLRNLRRAKDQGETAGGEKVFRAVADFECFEFRPRY